MLTLWTSLMLKICTKCLLTIDYIRFGATTHTREICFGDGVPTVVDFIADLVSLDMSGTRFASASLNLVHVAFLRCLRP